MACKARRAHVRLPERHEPVLVHLLQAHDVSVKVAHFIEQPRHPMRASGERRAAIGMNRAGLIPVARVRGGHQIVAQQSEALPRARSSAGTRRIQCRHTLAEQSAHRRPLNSADRLRHPTEHGGRAGGHRLGLLRAQLGGEHGSGWLGTHAQHGVHVCIGWYV